MAEFSLKRFSKWSKTSENGFCYGRLKEVATWIISRYYLQKNKYISNLNPVCFQFQKRVLLLHPVCIWNFINQVEYVSKKRIQFVSFLFIFYWHSISFRCKYYLHHHPWVIPIQGVITFFVLANFTLATFMDPGAIPKGKWFFIIGLLK